MAFKATLTVDGKDFKVHECISDLGQKVDERGRPISEVRGGQIRLILDGTDNDVLTSWATDRTKRQDGSIVFMNYNLQGKFKEINFEDAYITYFIESFQHDEQIEDILKQSMVFDDDTDREFYNLAKKAHETFGCNYLFILRISAQKVSIDGVNHNNNW